MPTIKEVYNPLVDAAINNDENGISLLNEVGKTLFLNNKDKCSSIEEGINQAKVNLDYYCQYFSTDIAIKVKDFYNLGQGYRYLTGQKF